MPRPAFQDTYFSAPLTNYMVGWQQNVDSFACHQAFSQIIVQRPSGLYWKADRAQEFRPAMKLRAPGGEAARSGPDMAPKGSFNCREWALATDLTDQQRAAQDPMIDLEGRKMRYLGGQQLLTQEIEWVRNYFKTGIWTDVAVTTKWSAAGSTPIEQIESDLVNSLSGTGKPYNKLIIGRRVWAALKNHAEFLSRVAFGTPGMPANPSMVTKELLASVLGIDKVIVSEAIYTTSPDGSPTPAYDFVAGKHALLCYAPDQVALDEPTAGAQFLFNGEGGGVVNGTAVRRYREDKFKKDVFEVEGYWDYGVVCAELGTFYPNVVA